MSDGAAIPEEVHQTHGLMGSLEEPDWPTLTLDEVDRLLQRYPQLGGALRILSYSPRPFSAASVVESRYGKVFVKRHHRSVRDREGLLEEHRFIAHLAAYFANSGDALVLPVLEDADGETAIEDGDWTYEVHPQAPGVDAYEQVVSWSPFRSTEDARAAGKALARLHQASVGYDAPARKPRPLVTSFTIFATDSTERGEDESKDTPLLQICKYLESRPLLHDYLDERDWRTSFNTLLMPLYLDLAPWLGSLRPLWTHNDFHASNLMWAGRGEPAEVRGIIDFGLSDRTNVVHDIATGIERNIIEWLRMDDATANIVHLDDMNAFLAGYEEILPLSYQQARALTAMLPLVHCEFALSETDYFLSVLHSREKAYLGYEGYFLAHAEWFRSERGLSLLQHLRQWAERHTVPVEDTR